MSPSDLPKIEIDAHPEKDLSVDQEILHTNISLIHGDEWSDERRAPDYQDPLIQALIQWLGRDKVEEMSDVECEALKRSVARLPDPVHATSFAWDAIQRPSDIKAVTKAVVVYRQFNPAAVAISEALGNNDEVRRIIRTEAAGRPEQDFMSYVKQKRSDLERVTSLADRIDGLRVAFKDLFGREEMSIQATVIAVAAVDGIKDSLHHLGEGLSLPTTVDDASLGELEKLRRHIVSAASKVHRMTGINPMKYSPAVLSGVRRSLGDDATADYTYAIAGLGGDITTDQDIIDSSAAFLDFFQQSSSFNLILTSFGLTHDDIPQLLGQILLRRHFMSVTREIGADWASVKDELQIASQASYDDLTRFLSTAASPGLTGALQAVSKGKMARPLADVAKAARKHTVTQDYWLMAGERVLEVQPDLRFVDLREVLRMEPEIGKAKEVLQATGANSSEEVDELEAHLEWMISAFALPIPDDAVEAIITSKATVVPMRLARN